MPVVDWVAMPDFLVPGHRSVVVVVAADRVDAGPASVHSAESLLSADSRAAHTLPDPSS